MFESKGEITPPCGDPCCFAEVAHRHVHRRSVRLPAASVEGFPRSRRSFHGVPSLLPRGSAPVLLSNHTRELFYPNGVEHSFTRTDVDHVF